MKKVGVILLIVFSIVIGATFIIWGVLFWFAIPVIDMNMLTQQVQSQCNSEKIYLHTPERLYSHNRKKIPRDFMISETKPLMVYTVSAQYPSDEDHNYLFNLKTGSTTEVLKNELPDDLVKAGPLFRHIKGGECHPVTPDLCVSAEPSVLMKHAMGSEAYGTIIYLKNEAGEKQVIYKGMTEKLSTFFKASEGEIYAIPHPSKANYIRCIYDPKHSKPH